MDSETSLTARQYRLQQWANQIQECQNRSPELSVKEWCSQRELNVTTYYYRLSEVRKACLETFPETAMPQSIVLVPSELMSQDSTSCSRLRTGTDHQSYVYSCDGRHITRTSKNGTG